MSKDKQSIQVTIRVRPLSQKQKQQDNRICVDVEEHTHSIQTFYGNQNKKFTFDSISNNNTQEDMFEKVGKKSTIYCLEGYNCTIFAYGQTGSGKTFTMMGVDPAHESYDELRGLIPRTLEYLFESIDLEIKQTSSEYIIRCSFLEIYNEQIIDLLNPKNNSNLQIREDIKKGVYVEGISEETIFKGGEALEILKKGSKGRHVGSTCYNETSSRSHSVFTMQIESKHTKNGVVNTKIRYFHFIDLAGSQRTKQINGERLKQGCSINKSLHVLGKVINSLAESTESKPRHINYRDSKLTFLLKDSLGGNSKTHLIANISPCAMSYSETNMTLAFARRVKLIKVNKASINEDMTGNLEGLKNEIKRLKQEIIMLKNGNPTLGMVSLDSSEVLNDGSDGNLSGLAYQSNTKMIEMLNRYVSEELEKQTRFEQEINKLNKKLQCLQNGIKKYAENQIHLKMIISVYDDKVKRKNKVESLLSTKIDELNSQSDESQKVIEYFRQERDELIKETLSYKKMLSENSSVLLKLLKSCKAYQGEVFKDDGKEELINLLKSNTELLNLLQTQLNEMKSVQLNGVQNAQNKSIQQVIEQKMALIDLEYSKKETELLERIEQLQLEIGEFKTASEESQMLLKDSVNREITLEEDFKIKENKVKELEDVVRKFDEKEKENDQRIGKIEREFTEVKQENGKLKRGLEEKTIKIEEILKSQSQSMKLNQTMTQTQLRLNEQNNSLKAKINQMQIELIDSTKEFQQKIISLTQSLKQAEQQRQNSEEQILSLKQLLQQKEYQMEEKTFEHKKEIEEMINSIQRLENLLIKNEKEITQLNEIKMKNEQKLKNQKDKILVLTENVESREEYNQKLSLNIFHLQHELSAKSNKIIHFENLLKDKENEQQAYLAKSKQKEEELLQIINQMQTSSDSSSEEFNKIRIQSIHLKQAKSQLQLKINKLNEQTKQLILEIQTKNTKIDQLKEQIEEKAKKILNEKDQINKKKEDFRNLTYNLEQAKSQCARLLKTITSKDQEFEEVHSKNIHLMQQSNHTKKQLNQTKLQLKQTQTKLFCQQKSIQIQKQTLVKENERKLCKLNEQLLAKTSEIKKLQKTITEHKFKERSLECEVKGLKELNAKNEELFKQSLEKELMNKSSEVNSLKETITLFQENLQNLKVNNEEKISELENQIIDLEEKQKQQTTKIEELKSKLLINQQNLKEKEAQFKSFEENIEEMRQKHERQLEDLEIQHNQQIDSKNEEIDSKNEEMNRKDEELRKKDQLLQEKNKQIQMMNNLLQQIKEDLVEKEKIERENKQNSESMRNKLDLKAQEVNKLSNEINTLAQSIETKDKELSEKRQQISTLKYQITTMKSTLELKEQIIKQTQFQADSQQHETYNRLNRMINEKEQQLQESRKEKQIFLIERQNLLGEKQILSNQVSKISKQILQQTQKIQQLQERLCSRKEDLVKLQEQNTQLSTIVSSLKKEISSLTEQLHQFQLSSQKNQQLISELNQQLHHLQKSSTDQNFSFLSVNKQLSTARTIIQSKQQEIHQLTLSMKEIIVEIDQVKAHKLLIEQKYDEICAHNEKLEISIEELNQKLNQINTINEEIQTHNQQLIQQKSIINNQLKSLNQHYAIQLHNQKSSHLQHSTELEHLIRTQKQKIQQLELQVKEKQTNLQTLSQISLQKQELMQSYKSLQQINKGLGRKCEELLTSLEEQKTEYRKLETKYLGEKNINENLKQLIQNSQQQKKHLSNQLKDKTQIYQKLVEKISKNESLHVDKEKKSQHYLKTVDLLEKSRYEQLQLRKSNQEFKRQLVQKTQLIQKKDGEIKEISKKYQSLQGKVKEFERDYLELESKYEELLENQKVYDKWQQQNNSLKQQLQQTRPKISRMTLKIQQLEERIRSINQEYIELQNENHDLKKKILYPGTTDERASMYINKLKSEINDLKKEKLILQDTIKKETSEKMKLKTEMLKNEPKSPENCHETQQLRQELQKRLTEIRYLQEIIAQMIDILNIKQFQQGTNPKSIKIESIRKGIVASIKEKIQENKYLKERIHEIESRLNLKEKQNKSISSIVYNGVGSQSSAKKQSSNQSFQSNQKPQRREKSFSMKEEEISHLIRNKITSSTISGQQYSQEKRERKGLQIGERTLVDNDEAMNSTKEKMKVKEILSNNGGKFYSGKNGI